MLRLLRHIQVCPDTAQKIKFSIKDFFTKCDQIRSFLRIWSHLLKKFLMENFIFCAVRCNSPYYILITLSFDFEPMSSAPRLPWRQSL